MAHGSSALTPQWAKAWCPTPVCRSGQADPLPGCHYLGGWEGMQLQVSLRSQKQDPPKSYTSAVLLSVKRIRAWGREHDGDTIRCTRPWSFWVFPRRLHLPGQCKGSQLGPIVGRAGLVNHTFWGPEVSLMLFLIYGDVIGNSLPIYEKHLNNTPPPQHLALR